MANPEAKPCPNCNSPIPPDFPACPHCAFDPSQFDKHQQDYPSKRRHDRRVASLNVWGEWIVALSTGIGLVCHFVAYLDLATRFRSAHPITYPLWIALVGTAFMVQAATIGAKMKTLSGVWGLLGLLSLPGLMVVHLIPKRCPECATRHNRFFSCRTPDPGDGR